MLLIPAFFVIGVIIGSLSRYQGAGNSSKEIRVNDGGFTNPLLECEFAEETIASKKTDFTPELNNFVSDLDIYGVSSASVYFRDLNNGPIVGLDQDKLFAPASLLKVPMLIAYLKWSEDKSGLLNEQILFKSAVEMDYAQQFPPKETIVVGSTYTVKELLERMIKYSDNQALLLLSDRIPKKYQEDIYRLLGVDKSIITDPNGRITVRQYSIFFRILFNSSFLSRSNSEYALNLLSQTTFNDGIRSVASKKVIVASKFGERLTTEGEQQIHDCGIVYYPNHPYLICIMTRGSDTSGLIKEIKEISTFVYKTIHEQYRSI